jgi:hypothetical protein
VQQQQVDASTSTLGPEGPPSKKRQLSLEAPPADVVEASSPPAAAAPQQPDASVISTERDERTSKDYYFDSYAHHAIRKSIKSI